MIDITNSLEVVWSHTTFLLCNFQTAVLACAFLCFPESMVHQESRWYYRGLRPKHGNSVFQLEGNQETRIKIANLTGCFGSGVAWQHIAWNETPRWWKVILVACLMCRQTIWRCHSQARWEYKESIDDISWYFMNFTRDETRGELCWMGRFHLMKERLMKFEAMNEVSLKMILRILLFYWRVVKAEVS